MSNAHPIGNTPDPADDPLPIPSYESLPPDQRRELDRTAERYRLALARDRATVMDNYLDGFTGPARLVLLRELTLEEWDCRVRDAVEQLAQDLRTRWPDQPNTLAQVLSERTVVHVQESRTPPPDGVAWPRIPRFDILEPISDQGATAVVYRAFERGVRRDVALKVLRPNYCAEQPAAVERFRREAARQSALHDAGVPAVFDVGFDSEGCPYIAMEWVQGEPLGSRLPNGGLTGRYGDADAARMSLIETVARMVAPAHRHGEKICHLDLSPHNVLITPGGRVVILDWGLGRDRSSVGPSAGGTPGYFAPEKAWGSAEQLSPRTDVYSLGCFLYHALVGRPPVAGLPSGPDPCGKFRAELAAAREHLRQAVKRRGVPHELVTLTLACLEFNPDDRPAHAGEVAQAMAAYFQSGEQERQQARLAAARRRAAARWGGVVLLLLMVSGLSLREYRAAAAAARHQADTAVAAKSLRDGDALAATGKWNDALVQFRTLVADPVWHDGERFEVRLRALRAATFLGDRATAQAELASLQAHPQAQNFQGRLSFEQAIQSLTQSMEYVAAAPGRWSGNVNQYEADAVRLLTAVRDDSSVPEVDRATARGLLATDAKSALGHYEDALRLEPFHPYAGSYYIVTCLLSGRHETAIARADAWAAAAPHDPLPWFYKAFACTALRRYDDADAALKEVGRAGGGRVLPLDTLRQCTASVKTLRLIDEWLPRFAVADTALDAALLQVGFLSAAAEVQPPEGVNLGQFMMFAAPLSPNQRQSFGGLLGASLAMNGGQLPPPGSLDRAEAFAPEGTVRFLRYMALQRDIPRMRTDADLIAKKTEMAKMMKASLDSPYHLWNIRLIAYMTLAHYDFVVAKRPDFKDTAAAVNREGKDYLRKAAGEPNLPKSVVRTIRNLAKLADDPAFTSDIEGILTPKDKKE